MIRSPKRVAGLSLPFAAMIVLGSVIPGADDRTRPTQAQWQRHRVHGREA